MKLKIDEWNGKYTVVPKKYNPDKEEGMSGRDIILAEAVFDSNAKIYTRKQDSKFDKAGTKFPMQKVRVKWLNIPPQYEQYLDSTYLNIDLEIGHIRNFRNFPADVDGDIKTPVIKKGDLFFIASVPYVTNVGEIKKSLTLERIEEHITPEKFKMAKLLNAPNNVGAKYTDSVDIIVEGRTKSVKICEYLPFWAFAGPESFVVEKVYEKQ